MTVLSFMVMIGFIDDGSWQEPSSMSITQIVVLLKSQSFFFKCSHRLWLLVRNTVYVLFIYLNSESAIHTFVLLALSLSTSLILHFTLTYVTRSTTLSLCKFFVHLLWFIFFLHSSIASFADFCLVFRFSIVRVVLSPIYCLHVTVAHHHEVDAVFF